MLSGEASKDIQSVLKTNITKDRYVVFDNVSAGDDDECYWSCVSPSINTV